MNSRVAGLWLAVAMPILMFAVNIVQAHRHSLLRVGGINEIHLYRFYLKSFRVAFAQQVYETTIEDNGLGGSESKAAVQPL